MPDYVEIPILAVAHRCGIQLDSKTLDRVEVQGYCPFCNARHNHLFLNTESNQWHCKRCGAGGNSVTLYGRVHGLANKAAFHELMQDKVLRLYQKPQRPTRTPVHNLAPLARRHDVYYDLLRMLKLSEGHLKNLSARGLSPERIGENMYRTMPADWRVRRDIACTLAKSHDLRGVPGFFTKYGEWSLWGKAGFLIPVLTKDGYIQGLQLRLDDTSGGKYRWVSSNPEYKDKDGRQVFENGTRAYSWVHVTGNAAKATVCITEGGLKGDIASFLRDEALFVCVPGVNNTEYLVETLKELNPEKVVLCYDMDQLGNIEVQKALAKMQESIESELDVAYQSFTWDPRYKGIDDYLLYRRNLNIA